MLKHLHRPKTKQNSTIQNRKEEGIENIHNESEVGSSSTVDANRNIEKDLLDAAKSDQVTKMVKLLTKRNVDTCDEKGISLLIWASSNGNRLMCEILLNSAALVDMPDDKGRTALYHAACNGHFTLCALLLGRKAYVNRQNNNGSSPLFIAAHEGHLQVCTLLLEKKADVNRQNNNGSSPLYIAANKGHIHVCNLLIKNNAHVNLQTKDGASPLFVAVQKGHVDICSLLLENNAHINQLEKNGVSPLLMAAYKGFLNVCTLLLENNANVNQQSHDGSSPLFLAAQEGHVNVCSLLLKNNADVNQQTNHGECPLMAASKFGHVKVCECLLQNNDTINLKNKYGNNALYLAVHGRKYDVCELLLKHGADVNAALHEGQSIIDIAHATDDQNIITLIKGYQNVKTINEEVEEARKHLKILEIKQIIEIKNQSMAKMRQEKAKVPELKQLLLQKQEKKVEIETQVELLIKQANERINLLSQLKNKNSPDKFWLQSLNSESQTKINDLLDQVSNISKNIDEYDEEIKRLEKLTVNYDKEKQECDLYKNVLHKGKYSEIIKELNNECPICYEEMEPPTKIFQCSEGHLLCDNCFKKVSESTKTCPFCKRDVVSNPIRNRALEEIIENKTKRKIGFISQN